MKKTILNISEMSDSKEVYGERPNPFISIFIYCIVGLLAAVIIYSCFGKMEIVATATGIVRPNDDVSTVSSLTGGRVTEASYAEGQIVKKGDKLLSVDVSEKQISLDALEKTMSDYEKEDKLLEKFLEGIENGKNPFSADSTSEEYPYYIRYRDYELSLKKARDNCEYDAATTAANIKAANAKIEKIQSELKGLDSYKRSVQQDKNLSSKYPEYESKYLLYASSLDELEDDYKSQYKMIQEDKSASNNEYNLKQYKTMVAEYEYLVKSIKNNKSAFPADDASSCKLLYDEYLATIKEYENSYEKPESAIDAYKAKSLAEYQQTLDGYKNKVAELEIAIASTKNKETQLEELESNYENSKQQKYLQTITQIDGSIQSLQNELQSAQENLKLYQVASKLYNNNYSTVSLATIEQISAILSQQEELRDEMEELDAQIKQLKAQVEQGTLKASRPGTVSVNSVYVSGDTIPSGTIIATIIPFNESEYKVNLYVKNSDIANVDIGDTVKYNLSALPSNQYGTIEGTITSIASDTLIQDGQYSGYYLVEGSIPKEQLTDKDGNTGTVSVGMQLEAKIITQEKTIIRYLLEKINLF